MWIIRLLSGSTSAVNRSMPRSRAGLSEVLEQQLGDAAALVLVLDQERDLGLARRHDVEATHGDHLALQQQHQRDAVGRGRPG